jgi:hypothetical protein
MMREESWLLSSSKRSHDRDVKAGCSILVLEAGSVDNDIKVE